MSLEKVEYCPICKGKSFQPFLLCKDHTVTGELFHVEKCSNCKMLLTNPRPIQASVPAYYKSSQYISHQRAAKGLIGHIYVIVRYFTLKWKLSLIKPYLTNNTLLDVGCGTASFLLHCKQCGVEVFGVEPSVEARLQATEQNIRVEESLEKLPRQKFDVITLWHVLEHIYDLDATLAVLKEKLADHGIIFIAVPNWQCSDASYYKDRWAGYDVPRHVWHFSRQNMSRLVENAGLKVKHVIPMKLDAYYVSLLSERNGIDGKNTLSNVANAIKTAYRSNARAEYDNNYSSMIYLVQK